MPDAKFTSVYTGQQVESAIKRALSLKTFEFEYISDENIGGTVYHILWKNTPTEDNRVSGFTIHPTTKILYEVVSINKVYAVRKYLTEDDTISTSEIDQLFN